MADRKDDTPGEVSRLGDEYMPENDSFGIEPALSMVSQEEEEGSPFQAPHRYHSEFSYGPLRASSTLRHVQRVSKRAALASKKVIWDSNDNAIDAAQSAVDQWEEAYNALRGILLVSTQSAKSLYGAAKTGALAYNNGILLPVRDWVLLPAFDVAERTVGFLQSEQAHQVASQSLQLAHQVPWIGPTVLAPAMVLSVQVFQTTWHIAQYPIPSRHQVRNSVDFVLTGTKWCLTTAGREILLYIKRADAIITRTLSHTRWKVLGSGPYATLDKLNKQEIIDHLCERYFSLNATLARYELAAHIRARNLPLYLDLVLTGLLRKRGGELTKNDEWLSSCPSYRKYAQGPFLLPNLDFNDNDDGGEELGSALSVKESALWFRLPYVNGKRPGRDAPWGRINGKDRAKLEHRYLEVFEEGKCLSNHDAGRVAQASLSHSTAGNRAIPENGLEFPATSSTKANDKESPPFHSPGDRSREDDMNITSGYPSVAKWHVPDLERDVMVDQKRQSVAYYSCCPRCRENHVDVGLGPEPRAPQKFGDICRECADSQAVVTNHWMASSILSPPPLAMIMRPNLWRFHGPGDEVRRAVWFLDTRRNGLQPYGEEAQAVLEDAYHFLMWRNEVLKEGCTDAKEKPRQPVTESTCPSQNGAYLDSSEDDDPIGENALLTIQVESPDGGEQQYVQFSSLTAATAINKGLGGAISLFKRRVYRGADLSHPVLPDVGVSPEAVFSGDVNLKSHQESLPKVPVLEGLDVKEDDEEEWAVLPKLTESSLAVPSTQFDDIDRDPHPNSGTHKSNEDDIDHLVLIVHGIGEMLQSVDLFGLPIPNLASIIDCCGYLRSNHEEVQSAHFSQMYPNSESTSRASTGRVEYLPIEWHEAFQIVSQRRDMSPETCVPGTLLEQQLVSASGRSSQVLMQDITLKTIPNMRNFANNTLFDVLYFMSKEHHDVIVDLVTAELNVVAQKFKVLTGFHGRVSLIGHSLGSIILWDILANQKPQKSLGSFPQETSGTRPTGRMKRPESDGWKDVSSVGGSSSGLTNDTFGADEGSRSKCNTPAQVGEESNRKASQWQYPELSFDVDNSFMLGSPIAVFLLVRNQREPLREDFSLNGCSRVFNLYHPFDPVGYRIEPLLDPRNAEFEPRICPHWNGGFRVQYQTKRLWRKFVQTTMQTQQNVIAKLEAGISGLGLLDSAGDAVDEDNQSLASSAMNEEDRANANVVTGKLNQGRRIDYMLQEKEIEAANEYVAALAAHSCYWQEKDLSLFIARQIYLSRLAHEQALHLEGLE